MNLAHFIIRNNNLQTKIACLERAFDLAMSRYDCTTGQEHSRCLKAAAHFARRLRILKQRKEYTLQNLELYITNKTWRITWRKH